jgi:hypothetical protein
LVQKPQHQQAIAGIPHDARKVALVVIRADRLLSDDFAVE